eukprot:scaffold98634_cov14-Tisochrysis_lutea.AAC.1
MQCICRVPMPRHALVLFAQVQGSSRSNSPPPPPPSNPLSSPASSVHHLTGRAPTRGPTLMLAGFPKEKTTPAEKVLYIKDRNYHQQTNKSLNKSEVERAMEQSDHVMHCTQARYKTQPNNTSSRNSKIELTLCESAPQNRLIFLGNALSSAPEENQVMWCTSRKSRAGRE